MPRPLQAVEASRNRNAKGKTQRVHVTHSQLPHRDKCQCTTTITTLRLESSSASPDSHAADDSRSESTSNGSLALEAHLDNASGHAVAFP